MKKLICALLCLLLIGAPALAGHEEKTEGNYIYALEYGSADFGYYPPFHTDVYDADRNLLISADAWFVRGFDPDYAILQYNDGAYGVMDTSGRTIIDGLSEAPWMDGHSFAYQTPRTGNIHYVRAVKNPLNRWLKPVKLDRRHMEYYLSLLDIDLYNPWAEALLGLYGDGHMCGVVDPDGNTIFEIPGTAVYGPDDVRLYRVQAAGYSSLTLPRDRWGYVDATGEYAIPPVYAEAYPFVDGAAVVRQKGRWHLIDPLGNPVGDFEWDWSPDMWSMDALALGVIPIQADGGYRVIDRRGDFVTDEVFQNATEAFGKCLMLTDANGELCFMDEAGDIALRVPNEAWAIYGEDDERIWIKRDGLWGLMEIVGEHPGDWRIPPLYAGQDRLEDGTYWLALPDGTAVYADRDGAILGPAPSFPDAEDYW